MSMSREAWERAEGFDPEDEPTHAWCQACVTLTWVKSSWVEPDGSFGKELGCGHSMRELWNSVDDSYYYRLEIY